MHDNQKNVLLISMPFAGIDIPSIPLAVLEAYLKEKNVEIKTKHLYLKVAEIFGINKYNFLINPPNDSYTAQMIFSKYVFPEHWKENEKRFEEYFNKKNTHKNICYLSFRDYEKNIDTFYEHFFEKVEWQNYDIIGFTLNYGQFLPSLAIAKKIKELNSEKIIVFGGSRTVGDLGKRTLETFPYIDFIVSGDGEEPLYLLATEYENYKSIPNLIYRNQDKITWNQTDSNIDLNILPIPFYDSFYEEMNTVSPEIQQFFHYNGKIPIEISRGCYWNKCTFCNLNIQHKKYREKNVDKIIEEINFLSNKYKILNFQIVSNTLLVKDQINLCKKIKQLGKDFSFFAEARADRLKSDDYKLLKEAGFDIIQTGIESLSSNYLKKMNKGVRVIDNIAALKFCKENEIINRYNLIVDYPNEETVDFEETKETVKLFKQYLEPPQICCLRILYGSEIFCNPDKYNISQFEYADIDKLMFPQNILEKGICFVYSYEKSRNDISKWEKLINKWKIEREMLKIEGIRSQSIIDQLIFYYVDGGNFIKIYDKRDLNNIQIYNLNEIERKIFISCIDIITFDELKEKLTDISENDLIDALDSFVECGIIFKEDDRYLALPLSHSKVYRDINKEKSEQNILIKQVS